MPSTSWRTASLSRVDSQASNLLEVDDAVSAVRRHSTSLGCLTWARKTYIYIYVYIYIHMPKFLYVQDHTYTYTYIYI